MLKKLFKNTAEFEPRGCYKGTWYSRHDFADLGKAEPGESVPKEWNDYSKAMGCYMKQYHNLGPRDYDKHIVQHLKLGGTIGLLDNGYKEKLSQMSRADRNKIFNDAHISDDTPDGAILNAYKLEFIQGYLNILPAPVEVVELVQAAVVAPEPVLDTAAPKAFCQCPTESSVAAAAGSSHFSPPPSYADAVREETNMPLAAGAERATVDDEASWRWDC
ncbi:hypothetical protein [Candidatus Tisiphia endosymbiont of Nemotelus uliginosus]|uniref:hypothetical protein n=1 Tax=Candidatus Tisiphia endosymbiont of Nemotelus uliginosus TaxID=3077926 RepID=UPI0035C8AA70